jgi:outer membrane protein OmpA-like peptidoglycan-associated protein
MRFVSKFGGAALLFSLCACQTTRDNHAQAQEERAHTPSHHKESIGTAVGAVAGAAAGALTGNKDTRGRNAAVGAVVGGVAGNRIGAHMDEKERELRKATAGTGVEVKRNGDNIELVMPGDITFATGSADVAPTFRQTLETLGKSLGNDKSLGVNVLGYTDNVGSAATNQKLSERRARTVGSYLQSEGVTNDRLTMVGHGEDAPLSTNATAAGRAKNRRVELKVYPIAH